MLLYEYPSKQEKAAERRELALMSAKRRKLGMRRAVTYVAAAAIVAIGVTADTVAAKIAICLLGVLAAVLCFVTSAYLSSGIERERTTVTSEGFVHETKCPFRKAQKYDISFSRIEHTEQNALGNLVIYLNDGERHIVPFRVTKTKLFLIKNMSGELKYPIKEYNVIDDDGSERKDWVDRL